MNTATSTKSRARAEDLVNEANVIQASELMLSPVGGGDRFLFDPFEVDQSVIDDWREAGLTTVVVPTFCMELDPFAGAIRQIAAWNAVVHKFHDQLVMITKGSDFDLAHESGKIGVMVSFHFADCFRKIEDVDFFHRLGLRNATIVVRGSNFIGTPHHERYESGLTLFGVALVERMNQIGIGVDIAHANNQTCLDVLEVATKPVVVSHANAYALSPHDKNKTDSVLKKMGENRGLMAIQPASQLVYPEEPVVLSHFLDLIEHVAEVAGPGIVAMGFEEPYQGLGHLQKDNAPVESVRFRKGEIDQEKLEKTPMPKTQRHITELMTRDRYYVLAEGMIERGFSDEDILGFFGLNARRAFAEIMAGDGQERSYESEMRAKDTNVGHVPKHIPF